jgi:hypothetical protein
VVGIIFDAKAQSCGSGIELNLVAKKRANAVLAALQSDSPLLGWVSLVCYEYIAIH